MTVLEIVKEYLRTHGFDGLYNDETYEGCACLLDDFAPCGELRLTCIAGVRREPTADERSAGADFVDSKKSEAEAKA